METVIDARILEDFFNNPPTEGIFEENPEYSIWREFRNFLKKESDVKIVNLKPENIKSMLFLNAFTTGGGDSDISFTTDFKKPYKGVFDCESNTNTFYCLYEEDEQQKKQYRTKNGALIAFQDDYQDAFKRLSLFNKPKSLPIRTTIDELKTWNNLQNFLLPVTNVVIVDAYIFADPSLIKSNLIAIIGQIKIATPTPYNLTIITYEGDRVKLNGADLLKQLKSEGLNAHISLVLLPQIKKEHDRTIVMNYLRIKSGDSFNYYDSNNNRVTHGTELDFKPFALLENQKNSEAILTELTQVIVNMTPLEREKRVFGKLENGLMKFN